MRLRYLDVSIRFCFLAGKGISLKKKTRSSAFPTVIRGVENCVHTLLKLLLQDVGVPRSLASLLSS